jgi:GNAT superfamily N-acetyltransferase
MDISLQVVQSGSDRRKFVQFPWKIYHGDPFWVAPIISDLLGRLDPQHNPFWHTAEQVLWLATRAGKTVGRIAGIIDQHMIDTLRQPIACFGFFECIDDQEAANALLAAVSEWARKKGMRTLRGPFNPSANDEIGILVEGFQTRPAILEAHTPPYYPHLLENAGFHKFNDILARLVTRAPSTTFEDLVPEKVRRVAERVLQRPDLVIRSIRMEAWRAEIQTACQIYNAALGDLPDFTPVPEEEFLQFGESFKPLVHPRLALMAELGGKPVGFALALPDINEALQHVNGRLDLPGLAKLWWYSRKLSRVSFKILMMLPEFQGRGAEAALVYQIARAIWELGYREIDMSLTGEENIKSTRFQDHLGFIPYRRYRIYEKELLP